MATAGPTPPPRGETSAVAPPAASHPPPPPRRRSDRPTLGTSTDRATLGLSTDRRAEYVPAPPRTPDLPRLPDAPRVPEEMPKVPQLEPLGYTAVDDPTHVQVAKKGSVPPPARGSVPPPPRTSSIPPPPPAPRDAQTVPPVGQPAIAQSVSAGLERLATSVRDTLPPAVRDRAERLPTVPLVAAAAAVAALVIAGIGFAATAGYRALTTDSEKSPVAAPAAAPTTDPPPEPAPAAVAPAKPESASAPTDEATVLLDLGDALLAQQRAGDVPALIARLIARQPEQKNDPRVAKLLLATAASDDRRASSESHALLTGPMGDVGAALLYELSSKQGVRDGVRARADLWLGSKDFERVASLGVYAAVKLKKAKSCEDKHALLDFAERAGGKYVLEYLRELDKKRACAPDDLEHCYPCMRNDSKLSDVIAKLEKRP